MVVSALVNPPPPTTTPAVSMSTTKRRQRSALTMSLSIRDLPVRGLMDFVPVAAEWRLELHGESLTPYQTAHGMVFSDNSARRDDTPRDRMSRAWREA